jgi:hypothetical protein
MSAKVKEDPPEYSVRYYYVTISSMESHAYILNIVEQFNSDKTYEILKMSITERESHRYKVTLKSERALVFDKYILNRIKISF